MPKPNVYVTRMLPKPAIDLLKEHFHVEINPKNRVLTRDELLKNVQGRDAVVSLLTDIIDEEVLTAAGQKCKIFANYAVGYNNIDVAAATESGILVSNTPGVLTDTTADLAWALLFATARQVVAADKFMRLGQYLGWDPLLFLGQDITGKTLGILGSGRIGTATAKKSIGFDMKVLYHDIKPNPDFEMAVPGSQFVNKETLLKQSDFVSIHVPLLEATKHLISDREFKLMKKTAILINTARGPIVDEKALVRALKDGEIWGAGLDVTEYEPDFESELAEFDNVVILPHIASASIETRTMMGLMAARNVIAALNDELPPNCLNPGVLNHQR
ncbi:2-hydroxyacid dehydrogenase [Anaerobacillus isosaccharinicus]|uniref:D-glycerate dehydrogenase n=1 Tax=Anaerobacillus isosaccharinicus TaxID=1532552 RepID=A0A1S2M737_9BACI|nr:D-glycerate dehydrogenase [Anaerobacillus isosaccharinicus]MBA5588301.1 D-glycerate dehydrogenase [Anaerobacillus isosaccharinicus]QOY38262.1 D-glycerate dehydrogenase [Anaerobacillus isosaccharinicus]